MRTPTLILGWLTAATTCSAQAPSWTKIRPTTSPTARSWHANSYDVVRKRTVVFGGTDTSYNHLNDTWEYNGKLWTKINPKTVPTARWLSVMVYDLARQNSVLFGGYDGVVLLDDTWTWNGKDWTLMKGLNPPSPRMRHGLAYDSGRQRTVLFGGFLTDFLADTWEWDGVKWTNVRTTNAPSPRYGVLAYDSARKRTVLFGGAGKAGLLDDTWEYDGKNWTKMNPATKPPRRCCAALAYDIARQRIVMSGGFPGYWPDTWEYDGKNWTKMNPATQPPGRMGYDLMVYDRARERMVLFGGHAFAGTSWGDTWEYPGSQLSGRPSTISIANGGTQTLTLNAGNHLKNQSYWIFGSATSTMPGVVLTGIHIPLTPDAYTDIAIRAVNGKEFKDFRRTLSATGTATASLNIPANLGVPKGLKLYHAFVVYDATSGEIFTSSNPVSVEFK